MFQYSSARINQLNLLEFTLFITSEYETVKSKEEKIDCHLQGKWKGQELKNE